MGKPVGRISSCFGQIVAYSLLMAFVGFFSNSPVYSQMPADQALIKLAFSHAGQRLFPCRERTKEELAQMPRHMRTKLECPRERSPIYVEMNLNNALVYSGSVEANGISHDGRSSVYERVQIAAGTYLLRLRMRDDAHTQGFNYSLEETLTLAPKQVLVIDFSSEKESFILR